MQELKTPPIAPAECYIAAMISPLLATHAGESCLVVLADNRLALLTRVALADRAERTLDVQYYIIRPDLTGMLLIQRLLAAADRGVRVRLLVDDVGMIDRDPMVAAIDRHPNIEVRLFNPFLRRFPSWLARPWQIITQGRRLTRRMHNKAFIADGAAAIVGGRNLGDEYFDAGEQMNFHDLDLAAFGPAAVDVAKSFNHFWHSPFAHRAGRLLKVAPDETLATIRRELAAHLQRVRGSEFGAQLGDADLMAQLGREGLQPYWGKAEVVYDDPSKIDPDLVRKKWRLRRRRPRRSASRLVQELEKATKCVTLLSPYLVPGRRGCAYLERLRERGVAIRVLTNSLAATDVPAVHAGYERYRKRLLRAGIEIREMRPDPTRPKRRGFSASSGASLHAKAFTIDGRVALVGSMNMDPRSTFLNTELGILVESAALAERIETYYAELADPQRSYRVTLEQRGGHDRLRWDWIAADGSACVSRHEPDAGLMRRLIARVCSWLPVEDQM